MDEKTFLKVPQNVPNEKSKITVFKYLFSPWNMLTNIKNQ